MSRSKWMEQGADITAKAATRHERGHEIAKIVENAKDWQLKTLHIRPTSREEMTMLKRFLAIAFNSLRCGSSGRSVTAIGQNAGLIAGQAEERGCRSGGADGPCGKRHVAQLFTRR